MDSVVVVPAMCSATLPKAAAVKRGEAEEHHPAKMGQEEED
jgi:hypothetical protein